MGKKIPNELGPKLYVDKKEAGHHYLRTYFIFDHKGQPAPSKKLLRILWLQGIKPIKRTS